MKNRLVIGLDSSTQSTKAIAWSAAGDMVAEGRADIPMSTPRKGYFEQDCNIWDLNKNLVASSRQLTRILKSEEKLSN